MRATCRSLALSAVALLMLSAQAYPLFAFAAWDEPAPGKGRMKGVRSIPFTTIDAGLYSGINTRGGLVVRNDGEWIDLWSRHTKDQIPAPPPPNIDFQSQMVVCVFAGTKPSGGYAVRITRVISDGQRLIAYAEESTSPGAFTTMALTQPYHIVKLAANDLPVVFEGL